MRFSINKGELQNALSVVYKGVSTRSTLPALSGILLAAEGDHLTLISTDLELSIRCRLAALVEEEGRTVVPGKLFNSIVKSLPDVAVTMEATADAAKLSCEKSTFTLSVLNPEDFPAFPEVAVEKTIHVPYSLFSSMVKRVARVVSRDESRAILTGVLITQTDGLLKMVATDSYRLAITEAEVEKDDPALEDSEFSAVIAGSFLNDVASMAKAPETIAIALAENQIVITCGDTTFVNRRIEGKFPNYQQLLPDHYETRAVLDRDELAAAVRRTSLLGTPTTPVRFDLNKDSQTLLLSSNTPDVGSATEQIGAAIEGADVEIAFNFSYVLDGLSVIATDEVALEIISPLKPGIFRAMAPERFLYLVMPIRIS